MFWTVHHPDTNEGRRDLSNQAKEAGWYLLYGFVEYKQHAWFRENDILKVFRIPLRNEIWFKNKEDLMAYKLRWQ